MASSLTAPSHSQRTLSGVLDHATVLGENGGFSLVPLPARIDETVWQSPLVREALEIFDVQGFTRPRRPLAVGSGRLDWAPAGTRISSLPIKFPYTDYRVPAELEPLRDILEQAAGFEEAINPQAESYYAYLTVQRTEVQAGEIQRGAAIHSDGIQGPRIQPKAPLERGYLMVDRFAPRFFCQAFDVEGVDVDRHLMDPVFASQADERHALYFQPNQLVMFDSYCVHQAVPAAEPGPRSFLRLAYSTRQYDRQGNSVNRLFEQEYQQEGWNFQPRPLPAGLIAPPGYE